MPSSLTSAQHDQLRVDLAATAALLDTTTTFDATSTPPEQATAMPTLYMLLAPDGPGEPVRLQPDPVDPALWRATSDLPTALTAYSFTLARTNARTGAGTGVTGSSVYGSGVYGSGMYGYALAYPSTTIGESDTTSYVILAVGRDGEAFLAGTGSPGPQWRMIAQALERVVLAAQHPNATAHLPRSAGPDKEGP
jgi:hypothetical protein